MNKKNKKSKPHSPIDTVLFDFDGTVMDTNDIIIRSWQHTFNTLEGQERPKEYIYDTFGEPLILSMERLFPDTPPQDAVEIYRSYHRENFEEHISLFPGIKELLIQLKDKDYKTGIVTSRLMATTERGMKKYGLEDLFDTVVTMEDCTKHKPDPQPIEIALKKLNSQSENSLMLGDTIYDILCARNGGVTSVLVDWAMAITEEERSGPDAPDYIIDTPQDLWNVIHV